MKIGFAVKIETPPLFNYSPVAVHASFSRAVMSWGAGFAAQTVVEVKPLPEIDGLEWQDVQDSELEKMRVSELCPRCVVCGHAPHAELVCGFRPVPGKPACLCTAMDGVLDPPKSARDHISSKELFRRMRPLQVVVSGLEAGFALFGLFILLKILLS